MRTPTELTTGVFTSPSEQKKTTTRLKRLAGGLRSEVASSAHGLDEKENKALVAAIAVVDELASRYGKAAAIGRRRQEEREKAEKRIRVLMAGNFMALSSVEDRIAFIAATHSYRLRAGDIASMKDLDYYFLDDLNSFIYRMSGELNGRTPEDATAEAWAKFEAGRAGLEQRHRAVILKLASEQCKD